MLNKVAHFAKSTVGAIANSLFSRLNVMFKGTTERQITAWNAQIDELEKNRTAVQETTDKLQIRCQEITEQGVKAATDNDKFGQLQAARNLSVVRRDLKRDQAKCNVFQQQIDILSTRVHNISLRKIGESIAFPRPEQLTSEAAEAESVLAELSVSASLAQDCLVTPNMDHQLQAENDILNEFETIAKARQNQTATTPAETTNASGQLEKKIDELEARANRLSS